MWWKLLLLIIYFILIFIFSRIIELFMFWQTGFIAHSLVDPFSLSVQKLRAILELRGLSSERIFEKKELRDLVHGSGDVSRGEALEADEILLESQQNEKEDGESSYVPDTNNNNWLIEFSSGAHFIEKVEDSKDGVWFVQILKEEEGFDLKVCTKIAKKMSRFGINTGIFRCNRDLRFCSSRGWLSNQMILSMPEGELIKGKMASRLIKGSINKSNNKRVFDWVADQLSRQLEWVEGEEELMKNWLDFNNYNNSTNKEKFIKEEENRKKIKLLLIFKLPVAPLFFSSMRPNYFGRVRVGCMRHPQPYQLLSKHNLLPSSAFFSPHSSPSNSSAYYLVISPSRIRIYGSKRGEALTFRHLFNFLRVLHPCSNDLFVFSFLVLWFFTFLHSFPMFSSSPDKSLKNFIIIFTKHNFYFLFFVCLFAISSPHPASPLSLIQHHYLLGPLLFLSRHLALIEDFSEIRELFTTSFFTSSGRLLIFFSSIFFFLFYKFFLIKLKPSQRITTSSRDTQEIREGATHFFFFFFSYLNIHLNRILNTFSQALFSNSSERSNDQQPSSLYDNQLDYGLMERLIERLAVPDLWLRPIISPQYIHDLPVWKHVICPHNRFSSSEESEEDTLSKESRKLNNFHSEVEKGEEEEKEEKKVKIKRGPCIKCKTSIHSHGSVLRKRKQDEEEKTKKHLRISSVQAALFLMDADYKCSCGHDNGATGDSSSDHNSEINLNEEMDGVSRWFPLFNRWVEKTKTCKKNGSKKTNSVGNSSKKCKKEDIPPEMRLSSRCSICLERYKSQEFLCGLLCGHCFHHQCIMAWLTRDNHLCPICRWPSYKPLSPQRPISF